MMKKLYTLLIVALIGYVGKAQVVYFADYNFQATLLSASSSNQIASTDTPDSNGNVNTYTQIDTNNNGQIEVSEIALITKLNVGYSSIADLTGIESFTNLQVLICNNNLLSSLNISGLTNLQVLYCSYNYLPSLDVSSMTTLRVIDCSNNQLTNLNVDALTNLSLLNCSNNYITTLNVSNLTILNSLYCFNNQLTTLNVNGLNNLQSLSCYSNHLTSLYISGLTYLGFLDCHSNQLASLDVSGLSYLYSFDCSGNYLQFMFLSGLTSLYNLNCSYNQLQSLDVSGLVGLQFLSCFNNQLTSLNLSGLTNLVDVQCGNNQIPSLNVSGLTNLQDLDYSNNSNLTVNLSGLNHLNYLGCSNTNLTTLDTSALTTLKHLDCSNNQITTIDTSNLTNLQYFECSANPLTTINASNLVNLQNLKCHNTAIQTLDVSNSSQLNFLSCENNSFLVSLFIKNGSNEVNGINLGGDSNLQYICADDSQVDNIQGLVTYLGFNCHVNSYCSFVPGGTFYTIKGNNRFDEDNNGCSTADLNYPNLKLSFTDGTNTGNLIPDATGAYQFDVQAGTQTFTPTLENPAYFNVSPTSASVTFPGATSPNIQDFCITATGVHNDLEVTMLPIGNARPGFDAHYQIIYKNKGTTTQTGTIVLTYNGAVSSFVSAIPAVSLQATNSLNWSFSGLQPFETRTIDVTININTPTATPPVNAGDILNYTATASGLTDETPSDNSANLAQTVFNSYDPNDKTCTEGTTVSPSMVGQYVHYIIHFENDGTANAQNIVVKDMIDTSKFDISTLVPLTGSANFTTRITNTNQVEFIFQNINLPFAPGTNGGYVAFKIKTKPTLIVGDTFSNNASIYFDYNAPIVTNTFTTTIQALATQDFEFNNYFSIYPSPAKNILNLETKSTIDVKTINIYNIQGQVITIIPNAESVSTIDVSNLKTGTYFIKVTTDKGSANLKFLKE